MTNHLYLERLKSPTGRIIVITDEEQQVRVVDQVLWLLSPEGVNVPNRSERYVGPGAGLGDNAVTNSSGSAKRYVIGV